MDLEWSSPLRSAMFKVAPPTKHWEFCIRRSHSKNKPAPDFEPPQLEGRLEPVASDPPPKPPRGPQR